MNLKNGFPSLGGLDMAQVTACDNTQYHQSASVGFLSLEVNELHSRRHGSDLSVAAILVILLRDLAGSFCKEFMTSTPSPC